MFLPNRLLNALVRAGQLLIEFLDFTKLFGGEGVRHRKIKSEKCMVSQNGWKALRGNACHQKIAKGPMGKICANKNSRGALRGSMCQEKFPISPKRKYVPAENPDKACSGFCVFALCMSASYVLPLQMHFFCRVALLNPV